MDFTLGIDDYRKCVADAHSKGKWQAWLDGYYSKYQEVFDLMFRYLYMADLASMRPLVEGWDFENGHRHPDGRRRSVHGG